MVNCEFSGIGDSVSTMIDAHSPTHNEFYFSGSCHPKISQLQLHGGHNSGSIRRGGFRRFCAPHNNNKITLERAVPR